MNITLIGYRGTGKSTVARLLAERLGWSWVDADAFLEAKAGQTIRQIFATEGEAGFREREVAALAELTARDRLVLAAGGGAVLRDENRAAIKRSGMTVWLVASPQTIERRMASDAATAERRPPLTSGSGLAEIRTLLAQREPLYRACADLVVVTDHCTPQEVVERILPALPATAPRDRTE